MTIKPARILALALAALGCGAQLSWGQQFQYSPMPGPAVNGVDPFAPGGMPQEPGPQPSTPYWHQTPPGAYLNQVNNENYYDPGQPDPYGQAMGGGDCEGSCAGNCGHGCGGPPQGCYIYTRAEVFALTRSISDNQVFATDFLTGQTLSASNLNFEYEPGIRGVVGVPLSECHTLEGVYFGQQDWSDSAVLDSTNSTLISVFGSTPGGLLLPGFNLANRQQITYWSELDNAELNMLHSFKMRDCKQTGYVLAGARYLQLKEGFDYVSQTVFNDLNFARTTTENSMVGMQLGGGGSHFIKPTLRVSGDAKAALMVNWADQNSSVIIVGNQLVNEHVQDQDLAFLADGGISLTWDITPWASVTGGYRVFYIDGAALASENFNAALLPPLGTRTAVLDQNGSALFHGATAGLEIRW